MMPIHRFLNFALLFLLVGSGMRPKVDCRHHNDNTDGGHSDWQLRRRAPCWPDRPQTSLLPGIGCHDNFKCCRHFLRLLGDVCCRAVLHRGRNSFLHGRKLQHGHRDGVVKMEVRNLCDAGRLVLRGQPICTPGMGCSWLENDSYRHSNDRGSIPYIMLVIHVYKEVCINRTIQIRERATLYICAESEGIGKITGTSIQ